MEKKQETGERLISNKSVSKRLKSVLCLEY